MGFTDRIMKAWASVEAGTFSEDSEMLAYCRPWILSASCPQNKAFYFTRLHVPLSPVSHPWPTCFHIAGSMIDNDVAVIQQAIQDLLIAKCAVGRQINPA